MQKKLIVHLLDMETNIIFYLIKKLKLSNPSPNKYDEFKRDLNKFSLK